MKISYETTFSESTIKNNKIIGLKLEEAAMIRIKEKILPMIQSYMSLDMQELPNNEKQARGEFFILHRSQIEYISSMLNILGMDHIKYGIMTEILDK